MPPGRRFTPGFQPEMVPSSVAKMKTEGLPAGLPLLRRKSNGLPLYTMPVGVDGVPGAAKPGGGTTTKLLVVRLASTAIFWGFPLPSSRVDVPELLLAIHHGLPTIPFGCTVGERVSPQEFFRLGSVWAAMPGMSEMRFVWV